MFTQTFRWSLFYHIQPSRHRRPIPFRCLERETTSPREPCHTPTRHTAPRSVPQSPTQFEHVRHTEFSGDTHESLNPSRLYGVTAAKAAITESLPLLLSFKARFLRRAFPLRAEPPIASASRLYTALLHSASRHPQMDAPTPGEQPGTHEKDRDCLFTCVTGVVIVSSCRPASGRRRTSPSCVEQHCTTYSWQPLVWSSTAPYKHSSNAVWNTRAPHNDSKSASAAHVERYRSTLPVEPPYTSCVERPLSTLSLLAFQAQSVER